MIGTVIFRVLCLIAMIGGLIFALAGAAVEGDIHWLRALGGLAATLLALRALELHEQS